MGVSDVVRTEAVCAGQFVNALVLIITRPVHRSRRLRKKHTMKVTTASNGAGFTLIEIMIVVAIIGLLAAIAIPNYLNAREKSQAIACIGNLKQIDGAAMQFALEQHKKTGDSIQFPSDLTPYIKLNATGSLPPCPSGGTYSDNTVGGQPACSLGNTVRPPHAMP
jgi:prepilin-type N-terminal cleavage/methylation domain-containing protein